MSGFPSLLAMVPANALNKGSSISLDPRQMKTWKQSHGQPQRTCSIDETETFALIIYWYVLKVFLWMLFKLAEQFSMGSDSAPPPGDICQCLGTVSWARLLWGRDQGCCLSFYKIRGGFHPKELSSPKCQQGQAEIPWQPILPLIGTQTHCSETAGHGRHRVLARNHRELTSYNPRINNWTVNRFLHRNQRTMDATSKFWKKIAINMELYNQQNYVLDTRAN